jgi:hypothetical protein
MRFILSLYFTIWNLVAVAQTNTIRNGHAHNDYLHQRPLFTALENGFVSIEVDVFLHRGKLRVAHVPLALGIRKTSIELYLQPLANYLDTTKAVLQNPLILMIDFKTRAKPTYDQLKKEILPFQKYLMGYNKSGVFKEGDIQLLISGSSPTNEVMNEDTSYVRIDGSVHRISDTLHQRVITRYSSNWNNFFTWKGKGEMPEKEKALLDSLVNQAHQQHKDIRFYHIPDQPKVWRTLLDADVDWINTDRLADYRKFYLEEYRR